MEQWVQDKIQAGRKLFFNAVCNKNVARYLFRHVLCSGRDSGFAPFQIQIANITLQSAKPEKRLAAGNRNCHLKCKK